MNHNPSHSRPVVLAIVVAALGYFVDIYDLVLFSVVRIPSLASLGVQPDALRSKGVFLLNMQMGGMLMGGILWGVIGDRRGRLSVLFGSILLYSIANIANGFVHSVESYALWRAIAGIGLAGELGAGITLVSEIMHRSSRGYGTTIVATVGILGAVVAALIGDRFPWRVAYFVGGGLGLTLLILRIGVTESGMFKHMVKSDVSRGNFFQLFSGGQRFWRYLSVILIGIPIWYVIGILVTFSKELGEAMGMTEVPAPGKAIMYSYIGLALGDLASGTLSQVLRSRKKAVVLFLCLSVLSMGAYFTCAKTSMVAFYTVCAALGFGTGYWAVFVTMASEQFGTNLRATATTTVPNFVRGAVVPMSAAFEMLSPPMGVIRSAMLVGAVTLLAAVVGLWRLEETYGKDLDFVEG